MLDAIAPMFTIRMGITPDRLAALSVPSIADHIDYLSEANQRG
ncbi:hypothetical protein [Streptomyces sp.]|nr:hypothetical protein [Streptomyces sp.]